jgi:hypothetical protein
MPVPPAFITVPIRPLLNFRPPIPGQTLPETTTREHRFRVPNDLPKEGSRQRNCNVNLDELRSGCPDLVVRLVIG